MSSDISKLLEDKVMVKCPSCDIDLAAPLNYFGKVLCPACKEKFPVNSEDNLEIEINDGVFWKGFFAPLWPTIIVVLLAMTGILSSNSSPDLTGLIWFMCSLILWPVIGFSIAKSRGIFVKSFREGARNSAIAAIIVGGLIWLWFLSFIAGGVTN